MDVINYNITDLPLKIYDGERIPFKNNSFDVVISSFVFHHCKNPVNSIKECMRVSKSKLIIIEDVYSRKEEKMKLKILDYLGNKLELQKVQTPFNFKTVSEWENIFIKNNLKLINKKYIFIPNLIPIKNILFELKKVK